MLMLEVTRMTRQQAQREAQKRWGARGIVRAGEALSSPEKRATAKQALDCGKTRRDAIDKEVQDRLNAEDWYRALMAERKQCIEQIKGASGWNCYYKFAVGKDAGIAFHVDGQGDTWEEAFAQADGKNVSA
jgi:hypothetical protein